MSSNSKTDISYPFNYSQSSLQDYVDCARRFQLRYIEHLVWPAIEAEPFLDFERRQEEGRVFHHIIQQYFAGLPEEKISLIANTTNLQRWWKNFRHTDFHTTGLTTHAELTIFAPIGKHRISAMYDLVTVSPEKRAIIFDWKTTHKRPKDESMAARIQTRLYRSLLVRAGSYLNDGVPFRPEQIEMIYWYADYPSEPSHFFYDQGQYERDWDALTGLIDEIVHSRSFPMTDDKKKCSLCTFRSHCDQGSEAGSFDEEKTNPETTSRTIDLNYEQIAEIEY